MSPRKSILLLGLAVVVAAVAFAAWEPKAPVLRKTTGLVATEPPQQSRPQKEKRNPVIRMDEERIALARIEQIKVGPATMATRLSVPAVIAPDADRVAHVSVKLSGTVAELRKNIGDEVKKGEILGALESREVADAKSDGERAAKSEGGAPSARMSLLDHLGAPRSRTGTTTAGCSDS